MGRKIAKIAVSSAVYVIDQPYDYLIPNEMEESIQPGVRVLVPFGSGNRGTDGVVLAVEEESQHGGALKAIDACLDERPVLTEKAIQLAIWMRERYFCTLYDCVNAMLPAGLHFSLRDTLTLKPDLDLEEARRQVGSSTAACRLLELLRDWGGTGDMEQIRLAFGAKNPNHPMRQLINAGLAELETNAQRMVKDKTEKVAILAMSAEEAMAIVTPRKKSAPLRYAVTKLLCSLEAASTKELCYFTGASSATIKSLEKSGILTIEHQEVFRRQEAEGLEEAQPVVLSDEQQQAFHGLNALCLTGKPEAALLYGVTGSGKTQVYIRLIEETLSRGKTALILVPEIILTPQLLRIFTSHFGKKVALLHSMLRSGERYDEWKRARNGEASVVVGTRSAIFAPLENLGLIILDEEQEPSYKSENVPRYHARDIAKYRCVQENALLVLGSATPSVETMYQAKQGKIHLFQLTKRYNEKSLPRVILADMKEELRRGNQTSISRLLQNELEQNLNRGEQSILFLNRRGANRMVSCGECGKVPECPRCSVKLTFHSANRRLMCHHCGYSEPLPSACPSCGGILNFVGIGTQKVQEEVEELFPGVEVLRMDTDTISAAHPHEELLERFRKEKVPILVGTQMVAKGLDFENVTLVGVVAPDLSLYSDDFRAAERTFSLLTQVIGRAGRGAKQGRAVIQTYTPEHDVIQSVCVQDYDRFYRDEIVMRELRTYPPFTDFIVMTASGMEEDAVLRCCYRLRNTLEPELKRLGCRWQLLGPAPAAVAKVNNRYRYRLTLSVRNTKEIRTLVSYAIRAARQDKENRRVSVFADLNPYYN